MKIKNIILLLIIFAVYLNETSANIFFSEIFPNTIDDKNLEYVEIFNSGDSEFSLSGVILSDKIGKEYTFSNIEILTSGERKKYLRTLTKIILNNSDEELYLKDSSGNIIDSFFYSTSIKGEVILVGEESIDEVEDVPEEVEEPEEILEENGDIENDEVIEVDTNTGELVEENNIGVPEIIFTFQNRTYLLDKDKILNTYICDSSKDNCKINLDFTDSFTGSFNESDYDCETDFGFINDQENKCNPASIAVPVGTFDFNLKIISKKTLDFSEKSFKIINNGKAEPEIVINNITYGSSSRKENTGKVPVIISKPEIIIQSGLNEKNICINRNDCSLNLKYLEKSKFEKCKWDFTGGTFTPGINSVCDPGYVKYPKGEFEISLRVYEKGDYNNFQISKFTFGNGVVPNLQIASNAKEINFKRDDFGLQIYGVMPNPEGSDDFEYIELKNNTDNIYNLNGCVLDDILDGGSKQFIFEEDQFLNPGEVKKYLKEITKLNLNNDEDEVNLFCNNKLTDTLKWNFDIKSEYYLDHAKLDLVSGKAKVIDVIDGDTIKIQFLNSDKTENFRLIGIDTPETKHPNKEVEQYGKEAYEFVLNNLKGKEVYLELDSENIRDTYSRLLGFVFLDGKNFNKEIIKAGFSKAYLDYEFKYDEEFIEAEKKAKEEKVGIWSNGKITSPQTFPLEEREKVNLESKITIQGKIGKNKSLIGNKLVCYDTCSVNFDGSESSGNIKKYSWDFGNGEKFEGKNPGYIKYENFGNYKVYLATVSDIGELSIEEFYVTYTKTPKKIKTKIIPETNALNIEDGELESEEVKIITEKENDGFNYSLLLYIIITIFGILIGVVILKREDLI